MFGMVLSSITGLVTTMMVSNEFGTSAHLDAFYAANRLTELLFQIMAGGALASAFLPTFTGFLTRGDREGAWRLASAITNLVLLTLTTLAILAAIAAPWIVRNILAPGFTDPLQINLTVDLLRVMAISVVIFGLSGILMSILNAHQHFLLPALAPAAYRFGWILGIFLLVPSMGIYGLAWGAVLGALFHLLIQLPGLLRLHARYYRDLGLNNPAVHQVGRLMAPRILGAAVVQINFLVNTILASAMIEGSLAAISFALALMIMPQAAIAQAAAIAALPTFSEQVARGDISQMRTSLVNTLRGVIFLALPASIGLILLRVPLVSMLLERGQFDIQSTEMVAWALLWYAIGLMGHSVLEIVVRAFYALKDTWTPVLVGLIAMTLNIAFSLLFASLFKRIGWLPLGGLALANSLATAIESLVLVILLRRRIHGLDVAKLLRWSIITIASAGAMVLALLLWSIVMSEQPSWLVGLGGILVGASVYVVAALALGVPEPRSYLKMLMERVR